MASYRTDNLDNNMGGARVSALLSNSSTFVTWLGGMNTSASGEKFLMVFDRNTLAVNGTVPLMTLSLPFGVGYREIHRLSIGKSLPTANGLVMAISTTPLTLTLAAVGDAATVITWEN